MTCSLSRFTPQFAFDYFRRHDIGARKVLTAAALTYVAAALQGILTLVYLLGRRR